MTGTLQTTRILRSRSCGDQCDDVFENKNMPKTRSLVMSNNTKLEPRHPYTKQQGAINLCYGIE